MPDRIATMGGSLVQHGPDSDRIYLMKLDPADLPGLLDEMEALAEENGYSKIFAKVPAHLSDAFMEGGFIREASVPGFFGGDSEALFLSRFRDSARGLLTPDDREATERNLSIARAKQDQGPGAVPPPDIRIRKLTADDLTDLAAVYGEVFRSYPFPIFDPGYLKETMESHVAYFGAFLEGTLVAASSAEMDAGYRNVEMTDFATRPAARGRGLAVWLLQAMEAAMPDYGIRTAYTIARSLSPGMNVTFAKMGYAFGGTLVNNTNIAGRIESMNVWHKAL